MAIATTPPSPGRPRGRRPADLHQNKLFALLRQQGCSVGPDEGRSRCGHPFKVTHPDRPGVVLSVGKNPRFDAGAIHNLRRKFRLSFGWTPLF